MSINEIAINAAAEIRCDPEAVWALAQVESGGGRGLHRFEPHVFKRLTGQRARTYAKACAIDPEMAARASSWGAFQVMGHYFQDLKYDSAEDMADELASIRNVEAQANSVIAYCTITSPSSGSALRSLNAEKLALHYNGPQGVARGYHIKFRKALAKAGRHSSVLLSVGDTGDAVGALQEKLVEMGYTLDIDGHFGRLTEEAVIAFQRVSNLKADGIVGAVTWTALKAENLVVTTRPEPTLGERGSVVIVDNPKKTVGTVIGGGVLAGIGGLEGLQQTLDSLGIGAPQARTLMDILTPYLPYLVGAAIAVTAGWLVNSIIKDFTDAKRQRLEADDLLSSIRDAERGDREKRRFNTGSNAGVGSFDRPGRVQSLAGEWRTDSPRPYFRGIPDRPEWTTPMVTGWLDIGAAGEG